MTKKDISIKDKTRLKEDIKVSLVLSFLFLLALITIVGLLPVILFLFGKTPSAGFIKRGSYILGLLFIPFLAVSWTNILKYVDLKKGKKLVLKIDDYRIVEKKDATFILTNSDGPKKIKIDEILVELIKSPRTLTIEMAAISKTILFISHDDDNLLEKLYSKTID